MRRKLIGLGLILMAISGFSFGYAWSDTRGEFKKEPKNLREELQQQTDEWLKGVV